MWKGDNEEEMAKFDGDTIRKETVFKNVSIVNILKATSEGFWLGRNKNRVTRMDAMQEQRVVVPQIWKKLVRRPSVFSKYVDAQHRSKYSYSTFRSSVSKCLQQHIQEGLQ